MKQSDINKAIEYRIEYLKLVGVDEVASVKDIIQQVCGDTETIAQFENAGVDGHKELQRLMIESCANMMMMTSYFDKDHDSLAEKMKKIQDSKTIPKYPNGGLINPLTFPKRLDGPRLPGQGEIYGSPEKRCNIKLPPKVGKVSDGSLRSGEFGKLQVRHQTLIKMLSQSDPACINGLTRIISEFDRPDILTMMDLVGLRGRAFVLGFIAKLCKYDITKMDAVVNAYNRSIISIYDIKHECIHSDGKRFNINHLRDEFMGEI